MTWRNCVASVVLAQEINQKYPNRDKASDGTIGDAAHASRKSDHNPWVIDSHGVGVVRARDIDEDLDGNPKDSGWDIKPVFDFLLAKAKAGDPRLCGGGYLISEYHIYSERDNWAARPYSGTPNPHNHHLHVSFSLNPAGYDSGAPWGLVDAHEETEVWHLGMKGTGAAFIADLGNIMAQAGYALNNHHKPSHVQLHVPTSKAERSQFVYDRQVRERVAEMQRFFVTMWFINGRKGPAPVVNGVADDKTLGRIAFWVPIALQKIGK